MSGVLQLFAGLLFVFFLPGYTLVNLLFSRKGELDPEYDIVYRIALGMGLSIVIAIIVGFALNAISTEEQGYVTAGPLWLLLVSITALFALGGWLRGAYPSAGLIHPKLYRASPARKIPGVSRPETRRRKGADRLILEREQLLVDLEKFTQRSSTSNPQRKLYYLRRIEQVRERIGQVNEELKRMDKEDS